jgi:hypothetical protein
MYKALNLLFIEFQPSILYSEAKKNKMVASSRVIISSDGGNMKPSILKAVNIQYNGDA